jgi:ABC-type nitrate/sulfonate/bicarbonate transport system substrate-binding protein
MSTMSRMISVLVGAALVCLVQVSSAHAQATTTLKYAYPFPEVEFLPLYAAQEKGFFKDEHLAVDLYPLSAGDKITLALFSGSVDIAYYTPDWFIRAMEKGDSNITLVAGGANIPVYSLIVTKDIKSYADLKGTRVGVSTVKASDAYLVRKMFAAHGLAEADYALIQAGSSGDRAAALKAGSVAGTLLIPPYDQRVVDEEGFKRLDVSSSVVTHYTWGAQAVRIDWAKANKATLVAYIRGWIKGTRWVYDPKNKEDAIRILARELKVEDHYARVAYEMYFASPTPTVAKDGEIDLTGLQELVNAMADQGDLTSPAPKADKYLDLTYWKEAHDTVH